MELIRMELEHGNGKNNDYNTNNLIEENTKQKLIKKGNRVTPKHHLKFIELVLQGMSKANAYKEIMKIKGKMQINSNTAATKGCTLYKKLLPLVEKRETELRMAVASSLINSELSLSLSINQVDNILCDAINNAMNEADRLRAIDIYYKRFGANAPVKNDVRIAKIGIEATEEYI